MANSPTSSSVFVNTSAKHWRSSEPLPDYESISRLHSSLPEFRPTPLISVPQLAEKLGLKAVLVKDESLRAGLPAYKVLGASWACFRAVCKLAGLPLSSTLDEVGSAARKLKLELVCATAGNHGRAVARMSALFGIRSRVFVSDSMYEQTRERIASESGTDVVVVEGPYEAAVEEAWKYVNTDTGPGEGQRVLVQDTAFEGYEEMPKWTVEGYSTLLREVTEHQTAAAGFTEGPTHIFMPVGAGSLGHAVTAHCKSRANGITVVAVEPTTAGCLYESLKKGEYTVIETHDTIMAGMLCANVSPISWSTLQAGVDASVLVTDWECHEKVQELQQIYKINAGPCGAGVLAGLYKIMSENAKGVDFGPDSVVVLLSTEGTRDYPVPDRL